VWGGPLATTLPSLVVKNPYADLVVVGQGEFAFRDIVELLMQGSEDLTSIENVYSKNKLPDFKELPGFKDMNLVPPYRWDLVDVEQYIRNDENINNKTINYVASQGCPFNCEFCTHAQRMSGSKWTMLKIDRIMQDIMYLITNYDINGIKLYDPNFFANERLALEFAQNIKQFDIRWAASAHPLNILRMSIDNFGILEESGCSRLLIGAESGCQKELDLIKKGIRVKDMLHIAKLCSRFNICGSFTFIVGFPSTQEGCISKTLDIALQVRQIDLRHECKVHFYAPYPGTPLYESALRYGFKPPQSLDEWAEYDYYNITTPWVRPKYEKMIHEFNRENCPYVADSRWKGSLTD